MGLDMYAYRLRKPTEKELEDIKTTGKIPDHFITIQKDDIDKNSCKDVKPFAKLMPVKIEYINMEQIRKDNDIPDNMYCFGTGYREDAVHYNFIHGDESKNIVVSYKDIEDKYTITSVEDRYIAHIDNVGYWRKEYTLQDTLHELYDGYIENCGFHKCSPEMIEAMLDKKYDNEAYGIGIKSTAAVTTEDEDIFYEEWY